MEGMEEELEVDTHNHMAWGEEEGRERGGEGRGGGEGASV